VPKAQGCCGATIAQGYAQCRRAAGVASHRAFPCSTSATLACDKNRPVRRRDHERIF